MKSKFRQELSKLIEEDIISEKIGNRIDDYYNNNSQNQPNRLLTIFGIFGSLLVGLGIILVLAHNWDDFSKIIKTAFAFLPLLIGQFIVGFSILKKKSNTWLEASGVFLFFAVGSSISLISQIYNIPGNLSSFFLTWILLCLPLVYVLKSKAVFFLTIVFSTVYACDLGYNFSGIRATPWMYILIMALLLPSYFKLLKNEKSKNTTALLNWLFPLSLVITFGAFLNSSYQFELLIYILFFGFLYNIGQLKIFQKLRIAKNGLLILGSLGLLITMLLASSHYFWKGNFDYSFVNTKEIIITILIVLPTLSILYLNKTFSKLAFGNLFQYVSIVMIFVFLSQFIDDRIPFFLSNLGVFILGVSTIKKGVDKTNFTFLNYGLLIITALIAIRFFDTDMSFVLRGLLFIIVGVGFFVSNYLMAKKMKSNR